MKLLDIVSLAAEGVKERKFRFALNLIGILIGCAAITGLISITQGMGEEIRDQLETFGPNNIMVVPGQLQPGRGIVGYTLSWRDLEFIRKTPHVKIATPIIGNKISQLTVRGIKYVSSTYGVYPEYFIIYKNFEISEGRALMRGDGAVAVIGALVAQPRDENEPIIDLGDRVKLQVKVGEDDREMVFRVVGILDEIGGTFGSGDDSSIIIPLRVCQQLYDVGGEFEYIAAMVDDIDMVDEVVERIEDKFGDSVMVMTQEAIQEMVGEVLGTIEAVLGGIAAIS
ncbi:MAG: ABC transporter permease, partial [Candidatus Bathyarchaeota archaeon]|nr:ABC transporter permease [Candidatus Bathyarchaeota archaeon]